MKQTLLWTSEDAWVSFIEKPGTNFQSLRINWFPNQWIWSVLYISNLMPEMDIEGTSGFDNMVKNAEH